MNHLAPIAGFRLKPDFEIEELCTFRSGAGRPFAIVGHNPDAGLVTDKWLGNFDTDENFRAVVEYVCGLFETGAYRFWLADLRHLTQSFFCSEDWVADVIMPRAIAAGLEREAVVLPPDRNLPSGFDTFGSASNTLGKIADGRIRGFHCLDEARSWLRLPLGG